MTLCTADVSGSIVMMPPLMTLGELVKPVMDARLVCLMRNCPKLMGGEVPLFGGRCWSGRHLPRGDIDSSAETISLFPAETLHVLAKLISRALAECCCSVGGCQVVEEGFPPTPESGRMK